MKLALLAVLAHPDDESFGIGGTLARYAREGVDVHIAIATDGVAGSVVEAFQDKSERLVEVRMSELEAAVRILGGTLHRFCYRDSGYVGDEANHHPNAFIQSDEEEAVGRVVKLIREVRPQVVITHDETGGYYHPDHIFCSKITTAAFHAAGVPGIYDESGLPPYQPVRLYYSAFPKKWVRLYTRLLRWRGHDPTKMGRNQDVDFTKIGVEAGRIHTRIDFRPYWHIKQEASAQHESQGGAAGFSRLVPVWLQKRMFSYETFMRVHPPVNNGYREEDLFTGLR